MAGFCIGYRRAKYATIRRFCALVDDRDRCQAAKIPYEVVFQTKPEIAQAMPEKAWAEGITMQWVTGDTLYGNSPGLRPSIPRHHRHYVMEVGQHHCVTLASGQQIKLSDIPEVLAGAYLAEAGATS